MRPFSSKSDSDQTERYGMMTRWILSPVSATSDLQRSRSIACCTWCIAVATPCSDHAPNGSWIMSACQLRDLREDVDPHDGRTCSEACADELWLDRNG